MYSYKSQVLGTFCFTGLAVGGGYTEFCFDYIKPDLSVIHKKNSHHALFIDSLKCSSEENKSKHKLSGYFLFISGEPVMVGVTMYILSISSVSEVMMVHFLY